MTDLKTCSLLEKLISRGDHIEIIHGRLTITPASGKEVPEQYLADNKDSLTIEIARLLNLQVYTFSSYSTGHYGKHNSAGVTLQFVNITTGEQSHMTFNAELKRARTTPRGKKGSSLPKGQFRITNKYMLYKFWLSTGLKLPPRLSVFHDYMGNLKQLYFMPNVNCQGKVIDKMIPLLNVPYTIICSYLTNILPYNNHTTATQEAHKRHTSMPNNKINQSHINKGIKDNLTTCLNNYELSKQGSAVTSNSLLSSNTIKKVHEQSNEEWLNEWEQS